MIVNWKKPKAGVKIVPITNERGEIEKNLVLLPGYNEVSEEDWNKARNHAQIADYIKRGFFEEVGEVKELPQTEEEKKNGKKNGKKKSKIKEIPLGKLKAEKALEVVNDTYQIETLEKWRKVESRDEIRAAIANQIEAINKGDIKNGSVNVSS